VDLVSTNRAQDRHGEDHQNAVPLGSSALNPFNGELIRSGCAYVLSRVTAPAGVMGFRPTTSAIFVFARPVRAARQAGDACLRVQRRGLRRRRLDRGRAAAFTPALLMALRPQEPHGDLPGEGRRAGAKGSVSYFACATG